MKNLIYLALIAIAAISFTACGPAPANNANTGNTNTNTAASTAAPTMDALLELDKKANEAYYKGDSKFFETFLSDKFVMYPQGQRLGKAEAVAEIAKVKCDVKRDWALTEPQMAKIDNDTYVLSYKSTAEGTCKVGDGPEEKIPSPMRAASVFVRSGDKWLGAFHGENLIVDPNATASPAASNSNSSTSSNSTSTSNSNTKSNSNTPSNSSSSNSNSTADSNSNSNSNTAAKPTPSTNTDALVKLHTGGWEAWKAKDAKKLTDMTTVGLSFVNPIGTWMSGQAAVVKYWTEGMKCEGVNTVKVADGFASAYSPTVEILTLKGTADGTCNGQKNGDLFQSAVYVKEGDAWKLAFMFDEAKMK